MEGSTLDRRSLAFALGLVGFAWAALVLLGPLALFLNWYGDCLSESCPSATRLDDAIYLFDIIAVVAVAVIALIAAARPRRGWYALVALIGLAFTAEAVAGVLGYRGLYAFSILLPAGALMTLGGVAGVRTLDDHPPPERLDSTEAAFGVGCAAFAIPIVALLGLSTMSTAGAQGLVILAAVVVAVALFVLLIRRRRPGRPGNP